MARPSVNMPDELERRVEEQLNYGDSKSEWFREATRIRLTVDSMIGDRFEDDEIDDKLQYIEEALKEKSKRENGDETPAEV